MKNHIHVDVQRHCMVDKRRWANMSCKTQPRLPNTRSNSSEVIGVSVDQVKKNMISRAREQTERSMASHHQKKRQKFEKAPHPIFCIELLLERRSQVQEGQADHSFSKRDSNKDNHYAHYFGMQSAIHSRRSVCIRFDRYNRNQEAHHREGPELSTEDFTNVTHRKDLTASGNEFVTTTTAEPLLKCHKKHVSQENLEKASIRDPTFDKEFRRTSTRVQRVSITFAVIVIHKWYVH